MGNKNRSKHIEFYYYLLNRRLAYILSIAFKLHPLGSPSIFQHPGIELCVYFPSSCLKINSII